MPTSPESAPRFSFLGYWVEKVSFSATPRSSSNPFGALPHEAGEPPDELVLGFNAGIGVDETGMQGQVTLTVTLTAEPPKQPYSIEVQATGRFGMDPATGTKTQLEDFCKVNAPAILFPYVRQIIHSLTATSRYGPILIPPVNMVNTLTASKWLPVPSDTTALPDGSTQD